MAIVELEGLASTVVIVVAAYLAISFIKPFLAKVKKQWEINRALDAFPSIPCHWLYGSMFQVEAGGSNNKFLQLHIVSAKKWPYGYRIWQGPFVSSLMAIHPDIIRPLLKVSDPKSWAYEESLKPWLGDGLLISHGKKWLRSRRLLTPAFHFDILKSYVQVFNDATEVFMRKLDDLIEKKESLHLFENVSLLTLDIILQCAFSYKTDCQLPGKRHPYTSNVYDFGRIWLRWTSKILYVLFPILFWVTPDGRRFSKICDNLHKEADIIISKRKLFLEEQGPQVHKNRRHLDFLDILLTAKDEEGIGMSAPDIRAEVDTFLFEGHDTTASGLSWTLYLMAKHPEHQQQIQTEVDNLVTELGTDRFDRSALSSLPVLTRCLKESMRLYPPVPGIGRTLSRDLTINGNIVKEGTAVNIHIWALHHNPIVWGEDHMDYRPERFSDENVAEHDPFAYIPFSAGPRNCIGQNFAMNEEKLVLARLLHRYTFSLPANGEPPAPSVRIVLRPEEEICLEVTRRK